MARKKLFYKIYFTVIALFFVVLTIALFSLHGWLLDYEAAQPTNIINTVTENIRETGSILYLKEDCNLKVSKYEKNKAFEDFYKSEIEGKELKISVSPKEYENADIAYILRADNKKIATVFIKKSENSSAFLPRYETVGSELHSSYYKSTAVNAPEDISVFVNGVMLEGKTATDLEVDEYIKKYLFDDGIKRQRFVIDNLLDGNAEIKGEYDGKPVDAKTANGETYVGSYISDADKDKIRNVATTGSKLYAGYMQGDATIEEVAEYFATDRDFYKNIKSSYTEHIMEHTPLGFRDVKNDEINKYSEKIYNCKVEFAQVLERNGKEYKIYFNKWVFLEKRDDGFKIIDIIS